jgi:hypothetical protein
MASAGLALRGRRPLARVEATCTGTGISSGWPTGTVRPRRSASARVHPQSDDGRACQLVSKQTNLLCGRWSGQLGRNTSSLTPHGHGFTSERPAVDGGDEMTTGVECVVDGTMG